MRRYVYFTDFITKQPSARSVPKPPLSMFCKEMPKKLSQVDGEFLPVNSIRGSVANYWTNMQYIISDMFKKGGSPE